MIKLTRKDWAEIYYALDTKALAVRRGKYAPENAQGKDAAWIAHIEKQKRKIGADGSAAADKGVTTIKLSLIHI